MIERHWRQSDSRAWWDPWCDAEHMKINKILSLSTGRPKIFLLDCLFSGFQEKRWVEGCKNSTNYLNMDWYESNRFMNGEFNSINYFKLIKYRVRGEMRFCRKVEMVRPWRTPYARDLGIFTVVLVKLSFKSIILYTPHIKGARMKTDGLMAITDIIQSRNFKEWIPEIGWW